MIVSVDPQTPEDWGTVVLFTGTTGGDKVTFGVDHRHAQDLTDALNKYPTVKVEVESWQIMVGSEWAPWKVTDSG